MNFIQRKIIVEFQLGSGDFGEATGDTVRVSGLRVQANIQNTSGAALGDAQVRIFGLAPGLLNKLSGLNRASQALRQNTIIIYAGDDVAGMATVFIGQITLAQIDLANVPDSTLTISAQSGQFGALQTATPTSYPGSVDAAIVMKYLANQMKIGYDGPNGVSVILSTPYFPGSYLDQVRACAQKAHIGWNISNGKLWIWPSDGNLPGPIPLISPNTGMVGYPSYSSGQFEGLAVTTIFNPLLRIAGLVQIESGLSVANGTWAVFDIFHALESETPGGKWFTQFNASPTAQHIQQ